MIAVITSTIAPSPQPAHDGQRTTLSPELRFTQTRETIASLQALGAKEIFLVDNSPGNWVRDRTAELTPARVICFDHPPIRNKGLGEMWLLLGVLPLLPPNEPILKISGRYRIAPDTGLVLRPADDIAGKIYDHGRTCSLSTRSYLIRDHNVAARLWERTLDEIYADAARIAGPRSLWRLLRHSLFPATDQFRYSDPHTSVELAMLRAIRHLPLRLHPVEHLAVTGHLGKWDNAIIKE